MKTVKETVSRSGRLFAVLAFTAAVLAPSVMPALKVDAALLTTRSITMASTQEGDVSTDAHGNTLTAGTAGNGAQTRHTFTYTHATTAPTIGSVAIQYCDSPLFGTNCALPTGMDASTITTIQAESGYTASDFAIDTTTDATDATGVNFFADDNNGCAGAGVGRANCILIRDTTPQSTAGTPTITLSFGTSGTDWIKNPTSPLVFYVRITTFSDAAFTTSVDDGSLAGAVTEDIDITAKVQEKLNFSVSATSNAPGTTCAVLPAGGSETMGTGGVLDNTTTSTVTSFFRLSTNASAGTGTEVQYAGDLLKTSSGTFSIGTAGSVVDFTSTAGTEQFGLTLDSADGSHSFTELAATTNYDSTTLYSFNTASMTTPVAVATTAAAETVSCDTGAVKYVANISTTTEPGTYRTNIMYFATPKF